MEKKNIVDSLVGIIQETEEQDKMLQSQNAGWRKELRERFDWTQNTTIKGKVELEKFIQELLDKVREEGNEELSEAMIKYLENMIVLVGAFNPMSEVVKARQEGELEAYKGILSKLRQ